MVKILLLAFVFFPTTNLVIAQIDKESTNYVDSVFNINTNKIEPSLFIYDTVSNVGFIDGFKNFNNLLGIELYFLDEMGKLSLVSKLSQRKRLKLKEQFISEHTLNQNDFDLLEVRYSVLFLKIDNRFNTNFSDFEILIEYYGLDTMLD